MSKSPAATRSGKAGATSERDLMRRRLQQVADSATAPGRQQAAGGSDPDDDDDDGAAAEATTPGRGPSSAPPQAAAPAPKRRSRGGAAPPEKFSVVLPAEEAAMLDGIKDALARQKVAARKVPDSWLIRLAIATFDPAGKDLAAILSRMKEQDGRGKR